MSGAYTRQCEWNVSPLALTISWTPSNGALQLAHTMAARVETVVAVAMFASGLAACSLAVAVLISRFMFGPGKQTYQQSNSLLAAFLSLPARK